MKSEFPKVGPPFTITEEELTELRAIIADHVSSLSPTQQRQVAIVSALVAGEAGSKIAVRLGVGHSTVCNVLAQVRSKGVRHYLNKWREKASAASDATRARVPGPKGTNTLAEWLIRSDKKVDWVADILHAWVARDEMIFVFGITNGTPSDDIKAGRSLGAYDVFRSAFLQGDVQRSPWNVWSIFDVQITGLLKIFKEGGSSVTTMSTLDPANPVLPVSERLSDDVALFALCSGPTAFQRLKLWSGSSFSWEPDHNALIFAEHSQLLDKLRGSLGVLRESWDGPGLLPWLTVLFELASEWAQTGFEEPFHWNLELTNMLQLGRQRQIHRNYHKAMGGLFELDARMCRVLPWREEFPMGTKIPRPRVEVVQDPDNPEPDLVALHILPQLGLKLKMPKSGDDLSELAGSYRQNLRESVKSLRFRYSNRDVGQQLGARMLGPMLCGSQLGRNFDTSAPCVLIPRHWMGPKSEDHTDVLALDEEPLNEGVFRRVIRRDDGDLPCLVFHAPTLISGIGEALRQNWYGDYLHSMYRHQEEFVKNLDSQLSDGFAPELLGFIRFKPSPFHWCLDQQSISPTQREREVFRWKVLEEFCNDARAVGAMDEDQTLPGVPFDISLANTIDNLDADLLLLGMDKDTRAKLDILEEQWSLLIRDVIAAQYNPSTSEGKKLAMEAVDEHLRSEATRRWSEVEAVLLDALDSFGKGARRVTRYSLENVQRQVLEDKEPTACFIETEKGIFTRWKAYLGKHIKWKLLASSKEVPFDDGECYATSSSSDVEDLLDLIRLLVERPDDPVAAKEFVELGTDLNAATWQEVFVDLPDGYNGRVLKAALAEALQIGRGAQPLDERVRQIQLIVGKLRQQLQGDPSCS